MQPPRQRELCTYYKVRVGGIVRKEERERGCERNVIDSRKGGAMDVRVE